VKRLDMGKAKEILRLREMGLSIRDIAASARCGKSSVAETIKRADAASVRYADGYTETELEGKLFPEKTDTGASDDEPDVSYLLVELGKKHVTRQLLWEEYKAEHPNGLMYTQFCERIRDALKADEIDYHKPHKAGEECEVDWAGTKIPYYDEAAKSFRDASMFVAVLPASNYPFAYAYPDEQTVCWIDAHVRTFQFYGGTPRILVPDCTKTSVTKTDLFDPVLSKTYYDMASHYDIMIVPARAYHPKDKNLAENAVQNASRRIIAALRNENFTSVEQINKSVREKLMEFIQRPFKKMEGCRRSAFEEIDKPALRPLPATRYELAMYASAKIGINYHVEHDGFFYSVPHENRGRECSVRATKNTIEVFVAGERVCAHARNYDKRNRYATLPEHLPENHRAVSEWNDERFLSWAGKYGPNTASYIKALLDSTEYSVQAYRSCMGVMRQAKGATREAVEAASAIALGKGLFSSKYFETAMRLAGNAHAEPKPAAMAVHGNIRGKAAYEGGGFHA